MCVDDGVDDHGFGMFPLHALSGGLVTTRLKSCLLSTGPEMSTEMQTTYGAPSLSVTFNHAVKTLSLPFQAPMRCTFSTSAVAVGISPIR